MYDGDRMGGLAVGLCQRHQKKGKRRVGEGIMKDEHRQKSGSNPGSNPVSTPFFRPRASSFFPRTQGRRNTAPRSGALEKSSPCLRAMTHGCLLSEVGGRLGPGGIYREFCVRHNGTLASACLSHRSNPSKNLPKKLILHHHAYPLPTPRRRPGCGWSGRRGATWWRAYGP